MLLLTSDSATSEVARTQGSLCFNPLSPNIHIQFLQTDLYYFLNEWV